MLLFDDVLLISSWIPLYMNTLNWVLTPCTSHKGQIHGLNLYLIIINPFMNNTSLRDYNDLLTTPRFIFRWLYFPLFGCVTEVIKLHVQRRSVGENFLIFVNDVQSLLM